MITGKRVLVVDDEFMVAAMLTNALEDAGAEPVGPASTVREALDMVAAHALDAALLDWNLMGEMSTDIARALAAKGVPFVVTTGYGSVGEEFDSAPRLAKPYTPEAMIAELGKLLGA